MKLMAAYGKMVFMRFVSNGHVGLFVFLATAMIVFAACGAASGPNSSYEPKIISVEEAKPIVETAYTQFIDVRTSDEFNEGHAPRARNFPLDSLVSRLDALKRDRPVYIICRTDNRSREAAKIMDQYGFKELIVLKGGTNAWIAAGFPVVTKDED